VKCKNSGSGGKKRMLKNVPNVVSGVKEGNIVYHGRIKRSLRLYSHNIIKNKCSICATNLVSSKLQ